MHIVLYQPEIPQNTGNIARTCAATGSTLHLIKPLGFSLADKYLKRAGLDYWHMMEYHVHESFEDLLSLYPDAKMYFLSTKAPRGYTEISYCENDFLVFHTVFPPKMQIGCGAKQEAPQPFFCDKHTPIITQG